MPAKPISKERANYQFIAELDGLPLLDAQYKKQCFSKHVHEGYCIGVIEQGAQRFYRSGGNHIASENCIILVNADQVHDGQTATDGGWRYKAMYPLGSMLTEVASEYHNGPAMPLFTLPVVSDRCLAGKIRNLFNLVCSTESALAKQTAYYDLIGDLLMRHATQYKELLPAHKDKHSARQICEYLTAHLEQSVSTQELATITGLNPCYLIRSFQKTMGLPPHSWQNQQRLQKATAMLKAGFSATDSGLAVGFNDQSHFTRHFQRMWGTTPGRFQKAWQQH